MFEYSTKHPHYFQLKEVLVVVFEEISNGVYFVEKDRFGNYIKFEDSQRVVEALNNEVRVSIIRPNKNTVTNFDSYSLI